MKKRMKKIFIANLVICLCLFHIANVFSYEYIDSKNKTPVEQKKKAILVRQGDKLAKKGQLPDYPGQQLLPKLVQVFERYGLAVKVQGKDLILSW